MATYNFQTTMGEDYTDEFVAGSAKFPELAWMNGIQIVPTLDGPATLIGLAAGWHLKTNFPDGLDTYMEVLAQQWENEKDLAKKEKRQPDLFLKCEKVVLLHSDNSRKEYWSLGAIEFWPLATGTPRLNNIIYNDGVGGKPNDRRGIAHFWWTNVDKLGTETSTKSHTKILGVIRRLYEAGYSDSNGDPLPVCFTTKGTTGLTFYEILSQHATEVVQFVRGLPGGAGAPFFAFSVDTAPADEMTLVGGPQKSKVFKMLTTIPGKGKVTEKFTAEHYCGDSVAPMLARLVKEVAVPWCFEQVTGGIINQVKLGKFKGTVPASAQERLGQSQAQPTNSMPSRQNGTQVPSEPIETVNSVNDGQIRALNGLLKNFKSADREDLAAAVQDILNMGDSLTYDKAREAINAAAESWKLIKAEMDQAAQPVAAGKPANPFLSGNGRGK